jgi:hypothetical protein
MTQIGRYLGSFGGRMSRLRALFVLCGSLVAPAQPTLAANLPLPPQASTATPPAARASPSSANAEWYFSFGTSKQYWGSSDVHVSQPSLGNDFTISGVRGEDDGFAFSKFAQGDLFGGQYNARIGRFINDARTVGIELSLDHTKYATTVGQVAPVNGAINGMPINAPVVLTQQFFNEVLHNGANHLMINGVYRMPLFGELNDTWSVSALGKAGVGVMLPHTTDTILGLTNSVGDKTFGNAVGLTNGWWQLNGWTTGAEAALRFVLCKPVYIELSDKVAYAQLLDLPAVQGNIRQSLWMNEIVASLGVTIDGSLFTSRR